MFSGFSVCLSSCSIEKKSKQFAKSQSLVFQQCAMDLPWILLMKSWLNFWAAIVRWLDKNCGVGLVWLQNGSNLPWIFWTPEASLGPYAWESRPVKRVRSVAKVPVEPSLPLHCESFGASGFKDEYLQHVGLKDLPRSLEVFRKIEVDKAITLKLPRSEATAGRVLEHSIQAFNRLHDQNHPMTFKFGITVDASARFAYYTKCSKDPFDYMIVLYGASNPHGPAFLEAALINHFKSFLLAIWFWLLGFLFSWLYLHASCLSIMFSWCRFN